MVGFAQRVAKPLDWEVVSGRKRLSHPRLDLCDGDRRSLRRKANSRKISHERVVARKAVFADVYRLGFYRTHDCACVNAESGAKDEERRGLIIHSLSSAASTLQPLRRSRIRKVLSCNVR